jgi:hypothetical protein
VDDEFTISHVVGSPIGQGAGSPISTSMGFLGSFFLPTRGKGAASPISMSEDILVNPGILFLISAGSFEIGDKEEEVILTRYSQPYDAVPSFFSALER